MLDIFKIIQLNWCMASVDLKDAFYSIPIHQQFQKYLKFILEGKRYKFVGMSSGRPWLCKFLTKMLKPSVSN